jgi:hypothetical protein
VNDLASTVRPVPWPTLTGTPTGAMKDLSLKPVVALTTKPSMTRMRLRWATTVPNGPQRKRSAYTAAPCFVDVSTTRKCSRRRAVRTRSAADAASTGRSTVARSGAWLKKTSFMVVRGLVATRHSRGARLTEQARMLRLSSANRPMKYQVEKTWNRPSLSRMPAQPP